MARKPSHFVSNTQPGSSNGPSVSVASIGLRSGAMTSPTQAGAKCQVGPEAGAEDLKEKENGRPPLRTDPSSLGTTRTKNCGRRFESARNFSRMDRPRGARPRSGLTAERVHGAFVEFDGHARRHGGHDESKSDKEGFHRGSPVRGQDYCPAARLISGWSGRGSGNLRPWRARLRRQPGSERSEAASFSNLLHGGLEGWMFRTDGLECPSGVP